MQSCFLIQHYFLLVAPRSGLAAKHFIDVGGEFGASLALSARVLLGLTHCIVAGFRLGKPDVFLWSVLWNVSIAALTEPFYIEMIWMTVKGTSNLMLTLFFSWRCGWRLQRKCGGCALQLWQSHIWGWVVPSIKYLVLDQIIAVAFVQRQPG